MIEFDENLWKERAWNKHKRCARSPKSKRDVSEAQWYRDVLAITKLKSVVRWCASKSLVVNFGKRPGGTYDTFTRTIIIACRAAPEKQLYYLLHECGHHLIGFKEHDERFGMGYPKVDDPDHNGTFHHRFACLEEEIEAWNRGWRLAKRLRLRLSRQDFDKVRLECLKSYVRWANGRTLLKSV